MHTTSSRTLLARQPTYTAADSSPHGRQIRLLLHQAGLRDLVARTRGRKDIRIALIDGSVFAAHPSLRDSAITVAHELGSSHLSIRAQDHATFAASILVGRGPRVVGLCPESTLLSIPIVDDDLLSGGTTLLDVGTRIGAAIEAAVDFRANLILLGVEFHAISGEPVAQLSHALAAAARAGVRTVVPTGNTGSFLSSDVLRAPAVVPVAWARRDGIPDPRTTTGRTISSRGLLAPGTQVPGALPDDGYGYRSGSSAAAAFVAGCAALLYSLTPIHRRNDVWAALLDPLGIGPNKLMVPRHLDGDASLARLSSERGEYERTTHRN